MPVNSMRYMVALLLFVGGGGALFYLFMNGEADAVVASQLRPDFNAESSREYVVSRQNISRGISLVGVTAAKQEKTIFVPGKIQVDHILVALGEHVKAGTELVKLNEQSYLAITGSTKAAYLEQLKSYKRAQNWQTSPEITRLRNTLEETKLRLEQSRQTLKSVRVLLDKGLVPAQEYDASKLTVLRDELALENARNDLNTQLTSGKENLSITALRFQAAKNSWDYFRKNYPDAYVRSPITGYVARPPEQGRTNQTDPEGSDVLTGKAIFTILATDRLLILALVGESDVDQISLGHPVQVRNVGGHTTNISGKVSAISRVNRSSDKSFPRFELLVEIDPEALGKNLRFGLSTTIFIETQPSEKTIQIPIAVLQDDGEGPYVWLKAPSGSDVIRKSVEIGNAHFDTIEIVAGVVSGDVLLIPQK